MRRSNTPKEFDSKVEDFFDILIGANGYRIISDHAYSPLHLGDKYGRNYVCSLIVGTVYNPGTPIASNSLYVPQVKTRINLEKGWRICSHDGTKHFNGDS